MCKKIDLLLQRREDNRFSIIDLMVMETAPKPQDGREDRQNGDDTHNKPPKTQYLMPERSTSHAGIGGENTTASEI